MAILFDSEISSNTHRFSYAIFILSRSAVFIHHSCPIQSPSLLTFLECGLKGSPVVGLFQKDVGPFHFQETGSSIYSSQRSSINCHLEKRRLYVQTTYLLNTLQSSLSLCFIVSVEFRIWSLIVAANSLLNCSKPWSYMKRNFTVSLLKMMFNLVTRRLCTLVLVHFCTYYCRMDRR